ncbi:MAG: CoA transferase [Dehalococcoidales bacterium]|nr:CoA transferase [Dehalococcoidales bacterium]
MQTENVSMLSPYRVLDMTDEKGLLCGKLLGDLGADVIKIERPGGDSARNNGPFYHDEPDPEKSLFWFAYNVNKRGITLDIETADGQELFKRLAKTADIVVESFAPGYMEKIGLGYKELEKVNPGIIMASITPFGQTGPYRDFNAPDIISWAASGFMSLLGEITSPPVRISHYSQPHLLAGLAAAGGALMALLGRELTGEGQHVDVSIQECTAPCLENNEVRWDMTKILLPRGQKWGKLPYRWPCKDGHVIWVFWGGLNGNRWSSKMINWMDKEGMADDFMKSIDWGSFEAFVQAPPDVIDHIVDSTIKFFMKYTRAELLEGAVKNDAMLFPVSDANEILSNAQLAARGYWVDINHPELSTTIRYPGSFVHASEATPEVFRSAPLIGEHNLEIYEGEFGIPQEKLVMLKQAGVI